MTSLEVFRAIVAMTALAAVGQATQTSGNLPYQFIVGTNDTFIETSGSNNSTAALFYVATAPGAEGIRRISTPWPITVGKAAFSVALYAYGLRESGKCVPEPVSFALKYLLNVVQSVGAVAFMLDYLAHGGKIPNVGIVLSLETFTILKYPLKKAYIEGGQFHWVVKRGYIVFLYIAICIIGIGTALFIASGVLEIARQGLNVGSVAIGVADGCPGGVTTQAFAPTLCSHVAPYEFGVLTDSDITRLVFWAGGCLLALANIPLLLKILRNPGEHFGRQDSPVYNKIAFGTAALTALLAIADQGADTAAVSQLYYDCRNATLQSSGNWTGCVQETITFPGSPSGFWDVWVRYSVAVLESIFAW